MRISARLDDAIRALVVLAKADGATVSVAAIAESEDIVASFLRQILAELKNDGLVANVRVRKNLGYFLLVPAHSISVADVVRVVDGPLLEVCGKAPEALAYPP